MVNGLVSNTKYNQQLRTKMMVSHPSRSSQHNSSYKMDLEDVASQYPVIVTLQASLKDMAQKPDLNSQNLFRWMKKLESFMSMESAKVRNKPNRATKISVLMKQLISHCKLTTLFLLKEDVVKMYPMMSLLLTYYLNIVLKSSLKNKNDNETDFVTTLATYGFVKLMLYDSPEHILDAILCSTIGECSAKNGFDNTFLNMVVREKYMYDKSNQCLLKYLAVVSLMVECGYSTTVFRETLKNYSHYPQDFYTYLKQNNYINFKISEFSLHSVVKAIHSRRIIQICKKSQIVIPFDVTGENEEDCDSEDTVSVGDDDTEVSSTNPAFIYPEAPVLDCDYESDSDESQEENIASIVGNEVNMSDSEEQDYESREENTTVNVGNEVNISDSEEQDYENREENTTVSVRNEVILSDSEEQDYEYTSDFEVENTTTKTEKQTKPGYSSSGSSVILEDYVNESTSNQYPFSTTVTTSTVEDPNDSSDDECGIIFEATVQPDPLKSMQRSYQMEERDEASPESGEDYVPVYTSRDYEEDSISDDEEDLVNPRVIMPEDSSSSQVMEQEESFEVETSEGQQNQEVIEEIDEIETNAEDGIAVDIQEQENEGIAASLVIAESTLKSVNEPKNSKSKPVTFSIKTRSKRAKETQIYSSQPTLALKKVTVGRKSRANSESSSVSPKRMRGTSLSTASNTTSRETSSSFKAVKKVEPSNGSTKTSPKTSLTPKTRKSLRSKKGP